MSKIEEDKDHNTRESEVETSKADAAEDQSAAETRFSAKRRRLLRLGLAAPVIMTVANKPVMGASFCTLSGKLSGNMSHHDGGDEVCVGEEPRYWAAHPSEWGPLGYQPGGCGKGRRTAKNCPGGIYEDIAETGPLSPTPFHTANVNGNGVYGLFAGGHYFGLSMMQVIQRAKEDRYSLGAQAVAALLNATKWPPGSYYAYGLTAQQVVDLWADMTAGHLPAADLEYHFQTLNEVTALDSLIN